jgi:hypothetical protein
MLTCLENTLFSYDSLQGRREEVKAGGGGGAVFRKIGVSVKKKFEVYRGPEY